MFSAQELRGSSYLVVFLAVLSPFVLFFIGSLLYFSGAFIVEDMFMPWPLLTLQIGINMAIFYLCTTFSIFWVKSIQFREFLIAKLGIAC